jgi:hypothetical protein
MIYALFGFLGALIKDLFEDNTLELPKIKDGKLYLGGIGGLIIGTVVAYLIDQNILLAFLAGFSYKDFLMKILEKNITIEKEAEAQEIKTLSESEIIDLMKKYGEQYGVDWRLALAVAKCESNLDPKALNINPDGSRDRGLFQINSKYHYTISDEQAFDPEFSIKFFYEKVKQDQLYLWNTSKSCWEKEYERLKQKYK